MKTYFTRSRILIWLVIILLIINISAVITILYSIKARNELRFSAGKFSHDKEFIHHHPGKSFKNCMNLNELQHQQFRTAKHRFFLEAGKLSGQMHEKRIEFINELASDKPDTIKIQEIANEIGSLHAKLKYQTYKHYIEMKSVCTKEQEEKLINLFKSMLYEDPFLSEPARHSEEGQRRHHKR